MNNNDYIYSDEDLPPIVKNSLNKKLKNKAILFYMKYLNSLFFKI